MNIYYELRINCIELKHCKGHRDIGGITSSDLLGGYSMSSFFHSGRLNMNPLTYPPEHWLEQILQLIYSYTSYSQNFTTMYTSRFLISQLTSFSVFFSFLVISQQFHGKLLQVSLIKNFSANKLIFHSINRSHAKLIRIYVIFI